VVSAANEAFVSFCQERIPGFPDCAGVNEYMKVRAPGLGFGV
jgi:putative hydrolase of the HAD superfamily